MLAPANMELRRGVRRSLRLGDSEHSPRPGFVVVEISRAARAEPAGLWFWLKRLIKKPPWASRAVSSALRKGRREHAAASGAPVPRSRRLFRQTMTARARGSFSLLGPTTDRGD